MTTATSSPRKRRFAEIRRSGHRSCFVDTSVLIALWGYESRRGQRNHEVRAFFDAVRGIDCELFVTPLTVEELFHATLRKAVKANGGANMDPKRFRDQHRGTYVKLRDQTLQLVDQVMRTATEFGVVMLLPCDDPPTSETAASGSAEETPAIRICQTHRSLLAAHPELDSMDAMHVAIAFELGCDAVATLDGDYEVVPEIVVYTDA